MMENSYGDSASFSSNKVLLELPAGKLGKGEDPFICAVRELEEETGI